MIESKYRIAKGRTIVGESAAGLFVVDTFFREPALFDNYIAMDPALWWNDHELVKQATKRLPAMDLSGKSCGLQAHRREIYNRTRGTLRRLLVRQNLRLFAGRIGTVRMRNTRRYFRATKENAFIWSLGKLEDRSGDPESRQKLP